MADHQPTLLDSWPTRRPRSTWRPEHGASSSPRPRVRAPPLHRPGGQL